MLVDLLAFRSNDCLYLMTSYKDEEERLRIIAAQEELKEEGEYVKTFFARAGSMLVLAQQLAMECGARRTSRIIWCRTCLRYQTRIQLQW